MPASTVDLAGKVINQAGTDKEGLTVSLYEAATWEAAGSATTSDTTDSDGLWAFTAQDISKVWLVVVVDGDKKFIIDGRNSRQMTSLDLITELHTNQIYEHTAASGVTIDGVVLKDGGVTFTGDLNLGGANLDNVGVIFLKEQAEADADVAASGQIWVNTATPNELYFTDDAGTDFLVAHNATTTLSSLVTVSALNSGSITSGFSSIDIGSSALSATGTITGPSGTWDAGGMDIAAGDSYAIAGTDVLVAATLGSGVTASSLTSVGTLTSLTLSGDINLDGNNIDNGGVIFLKEQAEADADVAGSGQLWVDTATPNVFKFTDDAGTDFTIAHNATTVLSSLVSIGTITTGVWEGTTVAVAQGGTGATSSTGTGNVVLSSSPALITPDIGTPSAGVVTNLTGTAAITIGTAAQAQITSLGTLTSLTLSGTLTTTAAIASSGSGNNISLATDGQRFRGGGGDADSIMFSAGAGHLNARASWNFAIDTDGGSTDSFFFREGAEDAAGGIIAELKDTGLWALGVAGTLQGSTSLAGLTSGVVTVAVAAAAGTWALTLPTGVAGTGGYQLTDAAGNGTTSWAAASSQRQFKILDGKLTADAAWDRILAQPTVDLWHYNKEKKHGTGDWENMYAGVMAENFPEVMHFNNTIFAPASAFGYTVAGFQKVSGKFQGHDDRIAQLEAQIVALGGTI